MEQARIDNIVKLLWPTEMPVEERQVYAILDGARDEQIERMVRSSNLPHDCLYLEPLSDSLRAAAPHLVALKPDALFTRQVLNVGWGKSWGIFLATYPPATLTAVRHNYRKLNIVEDPLGQKVFFRYYDPRVLRIYLPTCTRDEVRSVFGPVKEIIMEGVKPTLLHRFQHMQGNQAILHTV